MSRDLKQFVELALESNFPPEHPLRLDNWAGLAFDRNHHETFAPQAAWEALLATNRSKAVLEPVAVISRKDLQAGGRPRLLAPNLEALMAYLTEEFRFLQDHYVAGVSHQWLCRLDQDVTLMAGEHHVMVQVVQLLGGLERACAAMEEDLDPGPDDSVGLRRYLQRLVSGLAPVT